MAVRSGITGSLRSIVAFGVVGVLASLVHVVVGLALVRSGLALPFSANIFAFLTAFLVSYFGHRSFSFRAQTAHRRSLPRFFIVAVVGLCLNQIIVYTMVLRMMLPYEAALALVVTAVPALTYVLSRWWAFSETEAGTKDKERWV